MNYFFETYGCQMNIAESSAMKQILNEYNWTEAEDASGAGLIILNTCSVRATAETRVLGRLAHYKALKTKNAPPFKLLVAGCLASRSAEALLRGGADFVLGTEEKELFPAIIKMCEEHSGAQARQIGSDYQTERKPRSLESLFNKTHYEEGQIRSFVPVTHGCNNFCSYCVVPLVRGREAARPPEEIKKEIQFLATKDVREITLLGQSISSYRYEYGNGGVLDFPALLEEVASFVEGTSIKRVRFLSNHPKDFSKRTIEVFKNNPVYCRHLHLCVQHGSNKILEAMNRRYTREHYLELVAEIRSAVPDITFSSDILIGFPGETEEDFEEVLSLMREVKLLNAYMYHYNPREGTPAFSLPGQIPHDIKIARLSKVIALQKQHTKELLRTRIGTRMTVLAEAVSKKNENEILCLGEHEESVVVRGDTSLTGKFLEVTIEELSGNTLRNNRPYQSGQQFQIH
jgi:tRNA-2-methylthio-N6-dimethylallyladenosine synthase